MQEKRRLKTELISDNLAIQNILIMCRQMKFGDRPNYTKIQQHLSMTSY